MCFLQPLDFIGAFSSRDTGVDDALSQLLTSSKNIKKGLRLSFVSLGMDPRG